MITNSKIYLLTLPLILLLEYCSTPLNAAEPAMAADQCKISTVEQCWSVADELQDQEKYSAALPYYQVLCDLKIAKGCRRLGWANHVGEDMQVNTHVAAKFYQLACDLKDSRACNNLGILHENGMIKTANMKRANKLYQMSCDMDDTLGCYNIGFNYLYGQGTTRVNVNKGLAAFKKGCELGEARQCDQVAEYYYDNDSYKRAHTFYEKGCALDSGFACNSVGWNHDNGEGVELNPAVANQFYQKACDLFYANGCNGLGRELMHWDDELDPKMKKDESRGLELLELACKLGESLGCTGAGYAYKNGHGSKIDFEVANRYFIIGCDELEDPNSSSCFNMGLHYEQGKGVKKNKKLAQQYFAKACELGDEDSCDY